MSNESFPALTVQRPLDRKRELCMFHKLWLGVFLYFDLVISTPLQRSVLESCKFWSFKTSECSFRCQGWWYSSSPRLISGKVHVFRDQCLDIVWWRPSLKKKDTVLGSFYWLSRALTKSFLYSVDNFGKGNLLLAVSVSMLLYLIFPHIHGSQK